jgi:hypothetical protein
VCDGVNVLLDLALVQMSTSARIQRHTPVMASATTLKGVISACALLASWAMLLYQVDAEVPSYRKYSLCFLYYVSY